MILKRERYFGISSVSLYLFIFAFLFSCSKDIRTTDVSYEKSLAAAMKRYESRNYREAIDNFTTVMLNFGGEEGIDRVQFYIAMSHFELAEYYSASYEFIRLAERFPESELAERSYYMDAECYYNLSPRYVLDQSDTRKAVTKFQTYLDLFPGGQNATDALQRISELREKLARKEYEAGVLYLKLDQPRAARIYFNEIINNFYDTSFYVRSLKGIAEASLRMNDISAHKDFMARYRELSGQVSE